MALLQDKLARPEFAAMIKGCQLLLGHALPLADYLLKPVQRLLKYPLLLQELLKATPTHDAGYAAIEAAATAMRHVAAQINELKAQNEMAEYVEELQAQLSGWDGLPFLALGDLIDAATFKLTDEHNKHTQRYVLLFATALVICKWRPGGEVSIKRMCMMDKLFLNTMPQEEQRFSIALADTPKQNRILFHCGTPKDKRYWTAQIKRTIFEFYKAGRSTEEVAQQWQERRKTDPAASKRSAAAATKGLASKRRKQAAVRPALAPLRRRRSLSEDAAFELSDIASRCTGMVTTEDEAPTGLAAAANDTAAPQASTATAESSTPTVVLPQAEGSHFTFSNEDRARARAEAESRGAPPPRPKGRSRRPAPLPPQNAGPHLRLSSSSSTTPADTPADTPATPSVLSRSTTPSTPATPLGSSKGTTAPRQLKSGAWVLHLRFPNHSHTKVMAHEELSVRDVFSKALERRGFSLDEVELRGSSGIALSWDALARSLLEETEIVVVDLTRPEQAPSSASTSVPPPLSPSGHPRLSSAVFGGHRRRFSLRRSLPAPDQLADAAARRKSDGLAAHGEVSPSDPGSAATSTTTPITPTPTLTTGGGVLILSDSSHLTESVVDMDSDVDETSPSPSPCEMEESGTSNSITPASALPPKLAATLLRRRNTWEILDAASAEESDRQSSPLPSGRTCSNDEPPADNAGESDATVVDSGSDDHDTMSENDGDEPGTLGALQDACNRPAAESETTASSDASAHSSGPGAYACSPLALASEGSCSARTSVSEMSEDDGSYMDEGDDEGDYADDAATPSAADLDTGVFAAVLHHAAATGHVSSQGTTRCSSFASLPAVSRLGSIATLPTNTPPGAPINTSSSGDKSSEETAAACPLQVEAGSAAMHSAVAVGDSAVSGTATPHAGPVVQSTTTTDTDSVSPAGLAALDRALHRVHSRLNAGVLPPPHVSLTASERRRTETEGPEADNSSAQGDTATLSTAATTASAEPTLDVVSTKAPVSSTATVAQAACSSHKPLLPPKPAFLRGPVLGNIPLPQRRRRSQLAAETPVDVAPAPSQMMETKRSAAALDLPPARPAQGQVGHAPPPPAQPAATEQKPHPQASPTLTAASSSGMTKVLSAADMIARIDSTLCRLSNSAGTLSKDGARAATPVQLTAYAEEPGSRRCSIISSPSPPPPLPANTGEQGTLPAPHARKMARSPCSAAGEPGFSPPPDTVMLASTVSQHHHPRMQAARAAHRIVASPPPKISVSVRERALGFETTTQTFQRETQQTVTAQHPSSRLPQRAATAMTRPTMAHEASSAMGSDCRLPLQNAGPVASALSAETVRERIMRLTGNHSMAFQQMQSFRHAQTATTRPAAAVGSEGKLGASTASSTDTSCAAAATSKPSGPTPKSTLTPNQLQPPVARRMSTPESGPTEEDEQDESAVPCVRSLAMKFALLNGGSNTGTASSGAVSDNVPSRGGGGRVLMTAEKK